LLSRGEKRVGSDRLEKNVPAVLGEALRLLVPAGRRGEKERLAGFTKAVLLETGPGKKKGGGKKRNGPGCGGGEVLPLWRRRFRSS